MSSHLDFEFMKNIDNELAKHEAEEIIKENETEMLKWKVDVLEDKFTKLKYVIIELAENVLSMFEE